MEVILSNNSQNLKPRVLKQNPGICLQNSEFRYKTESFHYKTRGFAQLYFICADMEVILSNNSQNSGLCNKTQSFVTKPWVL